MSLVASHRNRDLAVLEQLSMGAPSLGNAVVGAGSPVLGAVVLPTCNRFEVYLETADAVAGREKVVTELARTTALDRAAIDAALLTYEDDDAVRHLMSVASGLESMVVGEREISGQVRRAYIEAQHNAHHTPRLDRLFQSALRTARVVASSTGLGTSGQSVVSVAFDLAQHNLEMSRARAVVIGTGAMAQSAVSSMRKRGIEILGVFSPSGRAAAFAAKHGLHALNRAGFEAALRGTDLVLACSGSEATVLTPGIMRAARADSRRPLTIIDLALHSDVAPDVALLPEVKVIDLMDVGAHAPDESPTAIAAARTIVSQAVAHFAEEEVARTLDPAVVALRAHVFGLMEREVARLRPAPGASEAIHEQAEITEQALRRFAKTLLHTPTVQARAHAQAGEAAKYLDAVRALYDIDVDVSALTQPAHRPAAGI